MEETIFRSPAKAHVPMNTIYEETSLSTDAGSKTNLLEIDSSETSPKINGGPGHRGAYTNISLNDDDDDEESEGFEVV